MTKYETRIQSTKQAFKAYHDLQSNLEMKKLIDVFMGLYHSELQEDNELHKKNRMLSMDVGRVINGDFYPILKNMDRNYRVIPDAKYNHCINIQFNFFDCTHLYLNLIENPTVKQNFFQTDNGIVYFYTLTFCYMNTDIRITVYTMLNLLENMTDGE